MKQRITLAHHRGIIVSDEVAVARSDDFDYAVSVGVIDNTNYFALRGSMA